MRESSLRQPPNAYFVRKYQWALTATDRNEPAAELIAVFLYHYENRTANKLLVELVQRAIAKHGKTVKELGDWMPYSFAYLTELLLETHALQQIQAGVKLLEKKGFISSKPPDEIKDFYSKSHSWYRLEIDAVQEWIDKVWMPAQKTNVHSATTSDVTRAIEEATGVAAGGDAPEPVTKKDKHIVNMKNVNLICSFDKHIHGRSNNFIYDKERKDHIYNRLKERKDATDPLALLAQATIGNLFSDWHQARHPGNTLGEKNEKGEIGKKYDDVYHIYSASKKLERHLDHAEAAGVTTEIAARELQAFKDGSPSKYAFVNRMAQESGGNGAQPDPLETLSPTDRKPYLSFAHATVRFFLTGVDNREIIDLIESNESLLKMGRNLLNAEVLNAALLEVARKDKPEGLPGEIADAIKSFAEKFTELNELNL